MSASSPVPRHRWWLMPVGVLLGLAAGTVAPGTAGCIYHDTCIKVTSPGHDWCRNLGNAKQWPAGGSIDDAEPILRTDGGAPRGCRCYNDAEQDIFHSQAPECRLEEFVEELALAARQECQSLVMPGYDHNCWTEGGPDASFVEGFFREEGHGSCIGNCEYGAPPVGGSCPNLNPYECATGGSGDEGCDAEDAEGDTEIGTGDSGLDDTGNDTSGEMLHDLDAFVACHGQDCDIDEAFARRLYVDPSPLLDQRTRFVYDPDHRRHVLQGVEPGSLAHVLGLRTGDRLESVDGMPIHDLDSALKAYALLGNATALEVRVKRGTQWLEFTYTFVP